MFPGYERQTWACCELLIISGGLKKKAERKMVVTPIWDRTWQTNEFVVLFVRRREAEVKGIISD